MSKAIVLLSGGQDSTTCLYWALKRFDEVMAIGFDYGQKHAQELKQAKLIADLANVEYKVFDIKGLLNNSSLINHEANHNDKHDQNKELPASFTAGRNALFLTIATSYAYSNNIKEIITGTCQTDYSGYPDCRREFIDAQEIALSLALDSEIKIHTPLMYLTKAETWKLAKDLDCVDIVKNYSLTDYNGNMTVNEWGFGVNDNPATALRAKGYYEAKKQGWI